MRKSLFVCLLFCAVLGAEEKLILPAGFAQVGRIGAEFGMSHPACGRPRVSGDGRFVVFEAREDAHVRTMEIARRVFIADQLKGTVEEISTGGARVSNGSPFISGNGRFVVFHSYVLDSLKMGETPISDIYLHDRLTRKSERQTFGLKNHKLDGEHLAPALNTDGRILVFTSNATIFDERPDYPIRAVYVYDRREKSVQLVSRSVTGLPANRPSGDPKISSDGRFIAYRSMATNLAQTRPLESLSPGLFLLDRWQWELVQLDRSELGFPEEELIVGRADMDEKGLTLVFEGRSRAFEDPLRPLQESDLFLWERSQGAVRRLSTLLFAKRSHSPTLSGDGRYVGFVFDGVKDQVPEGLIVYDIERDIYREAVQGALANPAFSSSGNVLVFESKDPRFSAEEKGGATQVYLVPNPFF